MPQSLAYIPVHVVFSTKNRRPLIDPELRQELYPLMGGILRKRDCNPVQVGGIADHIHLLLMLSRTTTVSDLKADSTKALSQGCGTGAPYPGL